MPPRWALNCGEINAEVGYRLNNHLAESNIIFSNFIHAHSINLRQTIGRHDIGIDRGCATPKSQGVRGIAKMMDIKFKGVSWENQPTLSRLTLLDNLWINPEKRRPRATANPLN